MSEIPPPDLDSDFIIADRHGRVVANEIRRNIHKISSKQVTNMRRLRNAGGVYAITISALLGRDIAESANRYWVTGELVLTSLALTIPQEMARRRYQRHTRAIAEDALRIAEIEPPIPVPDWVKEELDLE